MPSTVAAPAERVVRSAPQRARPVLGLPRGPSRARSGARHGRVGPASHATLRDLVAAVAAGAAAVSVLALAVFSGVPTGVALFAGAVVSASVGGVVLASWARAAVQDGASPGAARRQAVTGLALAHAVAAAPIGLAVLAAG
ncbi:unannotated protein [freshwater metagenome]|uniref:Unannotated protein n=1 Tax=freshwater metagenome TaxID=449393 RepID=A0A6J7GJX3_9ZZZZ